MWNYGCFMASPSAAHIWVRGEDGGSAVGSSEVVVVVGRRGRGCRGSRCYQLSRAFVT